MESLFLAIAFESIAEIVRLKDLIRSQDEKILVLEEENKFLKRHTEQLEEKLEEGKKQQAEDQKQQEETRNQLTECEKERKNEQGLILIKFIIKLIVDFRGK